MATTNKQSFLIHLDMLDVLDELDEKQAGKLLFAIKAYQLRLAERRSNQDVDAGSDWKIDDFVTRILFAPFKTQFDREHEKWLETVEINREKGKKGGNPNFKKGQSNPYYRKDEDNPNITQDNPNITQDNPNITQDNPTLPYKDKDKDKDNDNVLKKEKAKKEKSATAVALSRQSPDLPAPAEKKIDYGEVVQRFNSETDGIFGKIQLPLSDKRERAVKARIADYGENGFWKTIGKAAKSKFLQGDNQRGWYATFDWIIRPTNFEKIISGNFDDKPKKDNKHPSAKDLSETVYEQF